VTLSLSLCVCSIHEYTCPLVRYTYPLQSLYAACEGLLGWTYYGSAAPITHAANQNCETMEDTAADYVCAGLGIGYVILGVNAMVRAGDMCVIVLTTGY
jgi:hypothetical protein